MPEKKTLEEFDLYQNAIQIGEDIWERVIKWDDFPMKTLGTQFIRAADSIAANIAEGYGRYFYRDRKLFYYYARGSILETKTWVIKSFKRKLILESVYKTMIADLEELHYKLNAYIKTLKNYIANGNERQ